jgi:anti-sigma-K factor RskA
MQDEAMSPRQLAGKSLNEIADFMAGVTQGSLNDQMARAEFMLRQTEFQKQASDAAKATASHTQRYTQYMFWSIVILAISVVANLVVSVLTYLKK